MVEAADPETAVILLDIVLGYGSNEDPAGVLIPTITTARKAAADASRYLSVVAHVCGTELDPQGLDRQEEALRAAGVLVAPTNAQAARLAGLIVSGRG